MTATRDTINATSLGEVNDVLARHEASLNGGSVSVLSGASSISVDPVTGDFVVTTGSTERGRIKADGTPSGLFTDPTHHATVEELSVGGYLPSPGTSYTQYPIYVAPFPCSVKAFWLTPASAVAQSDTVFWMARLLRRPGKFAGPPSFIPTGSPATADGYYKTMIKAEANLVGYWPLTDATGITATDQSSGAHNATYQGQTVTVTIASPGVFTTGAVHGLTVGDQVTFNTTSALPTGLTAGTTYFVIAAGFTTTNFEVSLTSGGAAVNTSGTQSGTHQLVQLKYQGARGVPGLTDGTSEAALQADGSYSSALTASFAMAWALGGCYEVWLQFAGGTWVTGGTRYTVIGSENTASVPSLEIIAGTVAPNGTTNNNVAVTVPGTFVASTDTQFAGLEDGEWHHIVYQRTSGAGGDNTHQFYIDGDLKTNATGSLTTAFLSSATAHGLGRRAAASQLLPATSKLAHVAFYSAPLSAAQIARHYAYGLEFLHKSTRLRDGEAMAAYQGWSTEAFTLGSQAILAAGDTVVLEMEPFGSPATPGALGFGLRVEPI